MERVVTFSILLVRQATPRDFDPTKLGLDALKQILDLREVSYSEFKTYTRSKGIGRYIMVAKDEMRKKIEESKQLLTKGEKASQDVEMSGKFQVYDTGEKDHVDSPFLTDRSYAVIDTHVINGIGIVITINHSPLIPIFRHLLLKRMARILGKHFTCDVLSAEQGVDSEYVEHVSQHVSGGVRFDATAPYGTGLLTAYLEKTKIDINKVLKAMDDNVDVLMAPHDFEDYRKIRDKLVASKGYLEKMGLPDQNPDLKLRGDYADVLEELKTVDENMAEISERITKDPDITSTYFKFIQPGQLEEFAVRKIRKQEVEQLN